jgi:hypothetical protein
VAIKRVVVIALSLLLAVAMSGISYGASAASSPGSGHASSACLKPFDPYKKPILFLRACGDTILWLKKVTTLADGGKAYNYGAYTRDIPSANFDILTATDAELAEYGIPTRAQLGRQWRHVMQRNLRVLPATPYLVQGPSSMQLRPIGSQSGDCELPGCTYNWVGHYVTGHTYDEVSTDWTEPSFVGAGCTGDAYAEWAGLGGTTSPVNLAQTGTFFNYPDFAAHQGFIETIIDGDGAPVAADGFIPSPGDTVYASVTWNGAEQYTYYMQDGSNIYSATSRDDTSPDNSTAEVMGERPLVDGSPTELSDFQSAYFSGAESYWSSGAAGFYNNPNRYGVTMEGFSGDTLATTNNLSEDSNFTNTWAGNCS